ncbi:MGMT family protein [Duganella phyllosphaerae]|uniref:6-O-methylguanine DNA methyltransferase, DNA binding domain n=1 Tax=Duganella phyllosphaerae TaxID=762836 RepID=A0A1E7WHR7_9BURK|nr:MGMT family protein [Duganella phyllosphaerae]OEZ98034.1 6-O-methylguanine DNA methyltransferase, DNA binding domain [Duganella phyllosphaerae]
MPTTLTHLFDKPARHQPVVAQNAIALTAGLGIDGDVHAHRLSPRQVLVTLTSELDALGLAPGALYENLVIEGAAPEDFCPGSAIVSGDVEIRLTMYCEPCQRIAPLVGNLAAMVGRRGILGVVVHGGTLHTGDAVSLIPGRYPPLPASVQQKFRDFIATIPEGRVVRYRDVTMAIGVDDSFVRALPGYIKRNLDAGLPLHRIVNARGQLLAALPQQASMLAAEGVPSDGAVDLERFLWRG